MPQRTLYSVCARVKERMAGQMQRSGDGGFIEQLAREDDLAEQRIKQREPDLVAEVEERHAPPAPTYPKLLDAGAKRAALIARLEQEIADAEAREPAESDTTASEQRAATRAKVEGMLDGAARHARGTRIERADPIPGPWISRDG
jgi:hypothetical protein